MRLRRSGWCWPVEAGRVSVEVLGTSFRVERGIGQVTVAVERGRVRVLWDGHQQVLAAGHRETFPPVSDPEMVETKMAPLGSGATSIPNVTASVSPPMGKASATVVPAAAACPPPWTARPAEGPQTAPPTSTLSRPLHIGPESNELRARTRHAIRLLEKADAARHQRDPAAALQWLQELLRDYRADARAPLAAFTLGKLQMEELAQPEEAARSFALAQALEPDGPLAEDALAREVKAWDAASQRGRSRERAEEYLRRYAHGIRPSSVRRHGQLR